MCLHSHTSPIRQCDNDMLITVVRGHYREAGTVPDGAFNKILWGGSDASYLSAAHREKAVSAKHTAVNIKQIFWMEPATNVSFSIQWLKGVKGGGIKTTFFKIYSSQWSSFKTSCKSKLGYWTVPKAQTCIHHNI